MLPLPGNPELAPLGAGGDDDRLGVEVLAALQADPLRPLPGDTAYAPMLVEIHRVAPKMFGKLAGEPDAFRIGHGDHVLYAPGLPELAAHPFRNQGGP